MSGGAFNHTASGLMSSVLSLGMLRGLVVDERKVYKVYLTSLLLNIIYYVTC